MLRKYRFASHGSLITSGNRNENQLSTLKLQHNKECKGLIVQIRYLKAKFTREALFRDHLGYQKQYLLTILSQFEKRFVYPYLIPRPELKHGKVSIEYSYLYLE